MLYIPFHIPHVLFFLLPLFNCSGAQRNVTLSCGYSRRFHRVYSGMHPWDPTCVAVCIPTSICTWQASGKCVGGRWEDGGMMLLNGLTASCNSALADIVFYDALTLFFLVSLFQRSHLPTRSRSPSAPPRSSSPTHFTRARACFCDGLSPSQN